MYLKQLKSLIDSAHYGNDDPQCMSWQLLCQCFFSHVLAKRVFFQLNSKYKVGSSRSIYCSFPVSVKQNTPKLPNTCFASEPYSLPMVTLKTFQSG